MRLGKTQKAIIKYIRSQGGEHVYIGPTLLSGYYRDEVERSMAGLIRRKILIEVKDGFYTLQKGQDNGLVDIKHHS